MSYKHKKVTSHVQLLGGLKMTKYRPSSYKSLNRWAAAFAKVNKDKFAEIGLTERGAAARLRFIIQENDLSKKDAYKAAVAMSRSRAFSSLSEVRKSDLFESLSKEQRQKLRKLSGHYRYGAFQNDYVWNQDKQAWVLKWEGDNPTHGIQYINVEDSAAESYLEIVEYR